MQSWQLLIILANGGISWQFVDEGSSHQFCLISPRGRTFSGRFLDVTIVISTSCALFSADLFFRFTSVEFNKSSPSQ